MIKDGQSCTVTEQDESTLKTYKEERKETTMKSNKVTWNYVVLNMFISRFGGVEKTAAAAGMPVEALLMRLSNMAEFTAEEMQTLVQVLSIPAHCREAAFFSVAG